MPDFNPFDIDFDGDGDGVCLFTPITRHALCRAITHSSRWIRRMRSGGNTVSSTVSTRVGRQ